MEKKERGLKLDLFHNIVIAALFILFVLNISSFLISTVVDVVLFKKLMKYNSKLSETTNIVTENNYEIKELDGQLLDIKNEISEKK